MNSRKRKLDAPDSLGMFSAGGQDMAYQRPFMDVRELLSSVWNEKYYVIAAVIVAVAVVGLYLFIAPKTYTATAQILIDINRPLTAEAQSIGADTTRFMMGPVIDSQVEIISANRIIRRVIEKTGYVDSVDPAPEPAAGSQAKGDIPLADLNSFRQKLDVRRKGLTLILLVQFSDKDPERAALMANTVVQEYLAERDRMEHAASRKAVDALKLRVVKAQQDIANAEKQLQSISEANSLFSVGGVTLDERRVSETATQLNLARSEAAKTLADLQQWESHSEDKTGMATIGRIADARRAYEVARNQVSILEKNLADVIRGYATKSTAMSRYLQLQKETQATSDIHLTLLARIRQLETEQNFSMLDVQVLDNASVPMAPSSPNFSLVLAGGLVFGLGLGVSLALVKDHMSTVLRTPQLVHSLLGLSHIASLNRERSGRADLLTIVASQPDALFTKGILIIHRFLAQIRNRGQCVIAVVSASDGEGKSTVASALAQYAASISHQKTALIDCDIHQRTLSKRFAPTTAASFAQAVNGIWTHDSVMTSPPGCAFSFCAAPAEESTLANMEVLMSPGMIKFIKATSRSHDLVVLDTPALLNNVEARALVSVADIVILIVDARSTTVENIAAAKYLMPNLEKKLAGAVLNFVG